MPWVRFKKTVTVERAHADKSRGGYWLDEIPAGTVKEISDRSLAFWRARDLDCIEVIPAPAPKADAEEDEIANLFGDFGKLNKTKLHASAATIALAIAEQRQFELKELAVIVSEDGKEILDAVGVIDDTVTVLEAALEDLKAGRDVVSPVEFGQSIADVVTKTARKSRGVS